MKLYCKFLFTVAAVFTCSMLAVGQIQAQPALQKDITSTMKIPSVVAVNSSPAHLYVLSKKEGLAVFRMHPHKTQWLYSSSGMQKRGSTITSDVRFAYIFGNSRRLTVLEPTSVLGVYSSTMLPVRPLDAKRIDQTLYIALGSDGLAKISLQTPATVDSTLDYVHKSALNNKNITDLEGSPRKLFALSNDHTLFSFNQHNKELKLTSTQRLSDNISAIFWTGDKLYGANDEGAFYQLDANGNVNKLGSIDGSITKIAAWENWLIIQDKTGRLWTSYKQQPSKLWKKNTDAGNYIAINGGQFWLCEYNRISRINEVKHPSKKNEADNSTFSLKNISDKSAPASKPVLFPIKINGNLSPKSIRLSYQSKDIKDAQIQGQSFYWQPSSNDEGTHKITVTATSSSGQTSSRSFKIDVRSFNSPPQFAPVRSISIPMGHSFTLPIKAIDPDGNNKDLVHYLGVNLPKGASINESTGKFTWKPNIRQAGKNKFRVIATDQYGAANSTNITINVIKNLEKSDSGE